MKIAAVLGIGFVVMGWPDATRADDVDERFGGLSTGIHAGAAWGRSDYATDPNCAPTSFSVFCTVAPAASAVNGPAVAASGTGRMNLRGPTGGVQVGYNRQAGRIVYGGEADFSALALDETATASGTFPSPFLGHQYSVTSRTALDWMTTLRARFGMTVTPRVLLYATGGAAFARVRFSSTYSDDAVGVPFPGGTGSGSADKVKAGWVLGGGAQWALDRQWSVKAEYLYADLGSVSVDVPLTNTPAYAQTMSARTEITVNLVRIGLDYRF